MKLAPISKPITWSLLGDKTWSDLRDHLHSKTTYALRGSDFGKLKAAGVSDRVLDYLQQSFVNDVDLLTRYWRQGGFLGGCSSCYPQPVDVDKLESGYSEIPTTPPAGYQLSRPMGTPGWVPYPQHIPSAAPISVSDIEQMTKDGVPQAQIIDRINHCRPERFRVGAATRRRGRLPRAGRTAGPVPGPVHRIQAAALSKFGQEEIARDQAHQFR